MPKYIDADRFKRFLEGEVDGVWCDEICDDCIYELEYRIDHFPAADVRPERYARWIDMDDHLMCSGCGAPHNEPDKNYCLNCGAKMLTDDEIADGIGQAFSPD